MTKRQLAALQRIIDNETYKMNGNSRVAHEDTREILMLGGVHACADCFIVTDGYVVVSMTEKPEGLRESPRKTNMDANVKSEFEDGDYVLADTPVDTAGWRRQIADYKKSRRTEAWRRVVEVSGQKVKGDEISAKFNAELLVNAAEAVGTGAQMYIGTNLQRAHAPHIPYAMFLRKNWADANDTSVMAIVAPISYRG